MTTKWEQSWKLFMCESSENGGAVICECDWILHENSLVTIISDVFLVTSLLFSCFIRFVSFLSICPYLPSSLSSPPPSLSQSLSFSLSLLVYITCSLALSPSAPATYRSLALKSSRISTDLLNKLNRCAAFPSPNSPHPCELWCEYVNIWNNKGDAQLQCAMGQYIQYTYVY